MHARFIVAAVVSMTALSLLPASGRATPRVALVPIVVHSSAVEPHYLSNGLAEMLSARLEKSGEISVVRVETEGDAFRPGRPVDLIAGDDDLVLRGTGAHHYAVAPDGERFLMMQRTAEASSTSRAHVQIVFNWFDELNRIFAPAGAR